MLCSVTIQAASTASRGRFEHELDVADDVEGPLSGSRST